MEAAWEQMLRMIALYAPSLLGATAILVAGWLVGEERARSLDVEGAVGKGVFCLVTLLVLVAFFQALGLTLVTEPLNRALVQVSE